MKEWSRSRSILCVLIWAGSLNLMEAQEVGTVLPFLELPGTVVAEYVSYGEDRQPLQSSLDDLPRGGRDPIRGDDLRQLVTWKGSSRLPQGNGEDHWDFASVLLGV